MFCTYSLCSALTVYVLHLQCMFCTYSVCSAFTVYVLHLQCMFCTYRACSALTVYALHLQCMFCTYSLCSALTVYVLHLQCMFCTYSVRSALTVYVLHLQCMFCTSWKAELNSPTFSVLLIQIINIFTTSVQQQKEGVRNVTLCKYFLTYLKLKQTANTVITVPSVWLNRTEPITAPASNKTLFDKTG